MTRWLGIVARILFASVALQGHAPRLAVSQSTDTQSDAEVSSENQADRLVADRYEKILRSRPQMGTALDKFIEFHERQKSLPQFCASLQKDADSRADGNLFQFLGLLQLRSGLLDDAVASLTQAEQLLPNDPLASVYRSRALTLTHQYELALEALRTAINRKPTQAVALETAKELSRFGKRPGEEEVVFEVGSKIVQYSPTNLQVIEKIATCFVAIGRPAAAQPLYERLIELTREPQRRIELRMELAQLKKRLGQPEQSLLDLEQLVAQVKPQSWLHTALLEQIESLTEELQGAEGLIEYYTRWLEKRPQDVTVMLRLANVLRNQAQFETAEEWIRKAQASSPTAPGPLLALVDLLEDANQFGEASAAMQELLQLDPNNADFIVRCGQLSSADPTQDFAERQSKAAEIWRRLLVGHENDPATMIQVAELLQGVSLTNDAIRLYEQAIKASGGLLEYRESFGEYLLQIGRRAEARGVFTSAIAAASGNREDLIRLSEILTRLEYRDDAVTALQKACEQQPAFEDLLRLARLLAGAQRLEAAMDAINRAIAMAESSDELNAVWDEEISVYKKLSSLPDQLVALDKSLQDSRRASVETLQRLANMQLANQQRSEAAATALKATVLQPASPRAWLLVARMQREAGLSLREIESLYILCEVDADNKVEYLQRIAGIQFQLNQLDDALATAEKIFALPTVTLQHFQMVAVFCQQAKKPENALGILRRATRAFPNDRGAWLILSRLLVDLKDHPAAMDAAWRSLGLSSDRAEEREAIEWLASLYPGESGILELAAALTQFGQEKQRENEADLWTTWVLKESKSLQAPSEFIASVLKRSKVDPELLRAAVQLAVRGRQYSQAVQIQKRLCQDDSTVSNRLQLGELLALDGDFSAASSEWAKVMRVRSNDTAVLAFAKELIDKSNWRLAADLAGLGVDSEINLWEFIACGIHANLQDKNFERAAALAKRLLEQDVPQEPLVNDGNGGSEKGVVERAVPLEAEMIQATDRLAWLEHAGVWQATLNEIDVTRAGYRTNQSNPRASQAAAVRQLATQRGAALRSPATGRFRVECYSDARALAVLARFGRANQRRTDVASEWEKYVARAIESKSVGQLWDCVLVMEPARSRAVSFTAKGELEYRDSDFPALYRYDEILDLLILSGESEAIELAVSDIVTRRKLQYQLAERLLQAAPAMAGKELARLESLVQKGFESGLAIALAWRVTLAIELVRSQRMDEGRRMLDKTLAEETDIPALAVCARQLLSSDEVTQQVIVEILLRAFELELVTENSGSDLAFAISAFRDVQRVLKLKLPDVVVEMVRRQSQHLAGLSPQSLVSDSRSNDSRQVHGNNRKVGFALPDRSSMLSTSLRATLMEGVSPGMLTPSEGELRRDDRAGRAELAVRWLSLSILQMILEDPVQALASLQKAKEQNVASEILSLYEVRLLVASGRIEEAQAVLEAIDPRNEVILRECELWKMELATRLGENVEALRAARVLSTLSLSVRENSEVMATLNNKKGNN